jgi:hypothetical protein
MSLPQTIPQIYNLAQSFFLDSQSVQGAKKVGISAIDVFFKEKPNPTGNKSGINNPGVVLMIVPTNPDKIPIISPIYNGSYNYDFARVEYPDITTSSNASRPTKFKFSTPVLLETDKEYAFILRFDGNEQFNLWFSRQGDLLLGTNNVSPGPSGKYAGNYYTSYYVPPTTNADSIGISTTWKFLSDTDLKFKVYVARYAISGNLVGNSSLVSLPANTKVYSGSDTTAGNVVHNSNGATFSVSSGSYEYFTYDRKNSKPKIRGGEYIYQNTVFYPGGAANGAKISVVRGNNFITANSLLPNGQAFNWNSVYGSSNTAEYIVVVSLNDPTLGQRRTDVRRVISIESNTVLRVSEGFNFTNSGAYFMKTPVGRVDFLKEAKSLDSKYPIGTRTKQDMLILKDSSANASHRFVNDSINSISISVAGGGYNNNEFIYVYGFEDSSVVKGGYPAIANIVTNSSGNITAVYMSNVGAGFVNTANVRFIISNSSTTSISNSSSNTANGTAAAFTVTTGSMLRSEFDGDDGIGGFFAKVKNTNIELGDVLPQAGINNPAGTKYTPFYSNPYYAMKSNLTSSGVSYHVENDRKSNRKQVKIYERNKLEYKCTPIMPSRSNEYVICDNVTGLPNTSDPAPGSGIIDIVCTSNNDFICVQPQDVTMTFSKFNINNDYTGENTNYGNAEAKHITTKINFANERFAEDLLVYLTAYRPLSTDIKVFARIHNSNDPEAFDDKDWTMLELKDGNIYSSSANPDDFIEMTFGFQKHPNVAISLTGTVNVENTSTTNVIGTGTTFSTNASANLQVNDLVKIYSPLFPNNYVIAVVSEVANDTQFSISSPVSALANTTVAASIPGNGLLIDLIGRVGNNTVGSLGYPLQAFNNRLNDNVVRYYSTSMSQYDTYDSFQLKIILLSDIDQVNSTSSNTIPTTIPRVDDIRAVGVTA